MADPKPWEIINALAAQFAGITVANGYFTDAGNNVWTEPAQREDDVLGISISTDAIYRVQGERPNKRQRGLTLFLESAISVDLDNAHQLAHQLIDDLEKSLAAFTLTQTQLGGPPQTEPIEIGESKVMERPEGLAIIAVQMQVTARYWR